MNYISHRASRTLVVTFLFVVGIFLFCFAPSLATAESKIETEQEHWYRLRTNHVPYQPQELNTDLEGRLWMTATDEYDPAVWCLEPETGNINYMSNRRENNYLNQDWLNFIHKPQLASEVWYVLPDSRGNIWYALKDQGVWCEKANGQWISLTQENTGGELPSNSFHRMVLCKNSAGNEQVLLVSSDGLALVNESDQLIKARSRDLPYHNYMYNDALLDSKGRYWLARNDGLELGDDLLDTTNVNNHALFTNQASIPPDQVPITRIMEDSRGNLWFASNAYAALGVYCYQADGQWRHYNLLELFSVRNEVISMTEDAHGNIWLGLIWGGLLRYQQDAQGDQWTVYSGNDLGLDSDQINSLVTLNHDIWFTTGYNSGVRGNGTGIHCLPLDNQGDPIISQLVSYDYHSRSTSLVSNRIAGIAADRQGGVWFASYDFPGLARLKADGSWQQFRQGQNLSQLGELGIVGVVADAHDHVFILPQRAIPLAYHVTDEQWINLPPFPSDDVFFYGIYRDRDDGIWICSSNGAYYLDPDHSEWKHWTQYNSGLIGDYIDNGVLVDRQQRAWFQVRNGISVLDRSGNDEKWQSFTSGDATGYSSGYRVYEDDLGYIWNGAGQRYNDRSGKWEDMDDTSALDNRTLHFLNGDVSASMDLSRALKPIDTLQEGLATMDTSGRIYFSLGMAGLASVDAGVVVYDPGTVAPPVPPEEQYLPWTDTKDITAVPLDKEWRVRFSQPVDPDSLTDNLRIITAAGQDFAITPKLWDGDDNKTTVLVKPLQKFAPDTSYTLLISKKVKQLNTGQTLNHGWQLNFTTK